MSEYVFRLASTDGLAISNVQDAAMARRTQSQTDALASAPERLFMQWPHLPEQHGQIVEHRIFQNLSSPTKSSVSSLDLILEIVNGSITRYIML